MVRLSFKNTFISCEEDEDEEEVGGDAFAFAASGGRRQSAKPARSRSIGCMSPSREPGSPRSPSPDPEQMERLNRLLLSDVPTGAGARDAMRELLRAGASSPAQATAAEQDPDLEELRRLQRRLQEACLSPAIEEPLKKMSPAMHTVWSSGSVSTMASDLGSTSASDHAPEQRGAIEFGMTIEEFSAPPVAAQPGYSYTHDWQGRPEYQHRYRHAQVPRHLNLATEYAGAEDDGPPTTLMIRNIPNLYTQRELIAELEELGFAGTFDFLYAPLDKGTLANVGYSFVNFINHEWAQKCASVLHQHRFRRHRKVSGRTASVSVAHIQGLEKNLAHYEHTAVNSTKVKQHRPVVLATIAAKTASATRAACGECPMDY